MLRGFLTLAAIFALLAIACGDDDPGEEPGPMDSPTASGTSCDPEKPAAPGERTVSFTSGGVERSYIINIPEQYDGATRAPLILALHGLTMPAELMAAVSGLAVAGGERGAIVVFPKALGELRFWNWHLSADLPDDVTYIDELMTALFTEYCVDEARTFAAGLSLGGGMVQRLVCDRADRFAKVGVVAGAYVPCQGRVPVIAFHGDGDPLVPYEGGTSEEFPNVAFIPVRRVLSEWGRTLGCDGLPVISRNGGAIELSTFVNCPAGDGEAQLYTVIGGGHTWPGSAVELPPAITGPTTQEIDATELMLDFFLGSLMDATPAAD